MLTPLLLLLLLDKGYSADRIFRKRISDYYSKNGRESKSQIESYFQPQPPPQFLNRGNRITVPKGSSVTLPCRVENLGETTIIWKKGTRQVFVGNIQVRKDLRISLVDGTSLRIEAVDTLYAGNYTCEMEWSENEPPMEITHLLEVLVPPEIRASDRSWDDQSPDVRSIQEGDNITLECEASGIPAPSITWMTSRGNWVNARENQLRIPQIRRSDEGIYACIGSNGVGLPAVHNFTLNIQHSPIVTSALNPVPSGPGDLRAELNCIVDSEPVSTVNWYFNGSRLSSSRDSRYRMEQNKNNYSLVLFDVKESDLGVYTCSADNRIGQGETDIKLVGIPFALKILSPTPGRYRTSFNFTWSVKSFTQLYGTVIKKRKLPSDRSGRGISIYSPWDRIEIPASKTYEDSWGRPSSRPRTWKETYRFVDLESDSEYEVVVVAENKYGVAETNTTFVFKTSRKDPTFQKIPVTSSTSNWFSSASSLLKSPGLSLWLLLIFVLKL